MPENRQKTFIISRTVPACREALEWETSLTVFHLLHNQENSDIFIVNINQDSISFFQLKATTEG